MATRNVDEMRQQENRIDHLTTDDERLQQLEERYAHQAHELETLSDIVRRQADEIDVLKKAILRLRDRLTEVEEGTAGPHEQTLPPHY